MSFSSDARLLMLLVFGVLRWLSSAAFEDVVRILLECETEGKVTRGESIVIFVVILSTHSWLHVAM